MKSIFRRIRSYWVAGFLFWLPIWATIAVVRFIINLLNNTLTLFPEHYKLAVFKEVNFPGAGIVISLIVVFLTGLLVTNIVGRKLVAFGELILAKIPLVRVIYLAVKQILESLFASNGQSFRKVLLVEYPRKGLWSLAFLTGSNIKEIMHKTGKDSVVIYIPTTPNPTSGFILVVPKSEIIELDMGVDEALKVIISLGTVRPE